jgi:hypothetical protein
MPPKVAITDLEVYCDTMIKSWRTYYKQERYDEALAVTSKFIAELKPIYNERLYGEGNDEGESYTYIYLFLMLAKSFEDLINLAQLTKDKAWPEDNKKTELIWQVLWDAKERLDKFNSHCLESGLFENIYKQLKRLEMYFYDYFGKGVYMSPVIKIKKAICSICGLNIKACNHIPGNIFHGNPCREVVEDMEIYGADMVQSPHDMRCRIWPWNFIDKNRMNVRVMNLNQLDGFIKEP